MRATRESRMFTHVEKNDFDVKTNATGQAKFSLQSANNCLSQHTSNRSPRTHGLSVTSHANAYSLHVLRPIRTPHPNCVNQDGYSLRPKANSQHTLWVSRKPACPTTRHTQGYTNRINTVPSSSSVFGKRTFLFFGNEWK